MGKGGGQTTTTVSQAPPPTEEERQLTALNIQLAQKQLEQINSLQPFQQELLNQALTQLKTQSAIDQAITPEQQAQAFKDEFTRSQKLGPIQDELLQLQLDQLRSGGAATPEQIAKIKEATDAAITAGSGDIDLSTQRGIGLISDQLANSRGLRLSDSPITSEAALLARSGEDQKASLIKNLRAGEVASRLNFPLAVQQLQSGVNINQQEINNSVRQFQQGLQQQAYQNRLAMAGSTGLGLTGATSGIGSDTLRNLTNSRLSNSTQTATTNRRYGLGDYILGATRVAGTFL